MRAWLLDDQRGLTSLRLAEIADPAPAAGEVVLRVRYAALNPADRYLAAGQYPAKPKFPHILGRDGIGSVIKIGAGVDSICEGEQLLILRSEVGVNRPGTFAEQIAVPIESLVKPPAGWSDQEAAAAPLVYLTAYQALTQWGELPPSVVLITGASGGVGVASVQLARAMGHVVVALSRSREKRERLKELGANYTLDPTDPAWMRACKQVLGERRVDLAIDNIGGELFSTVLETLGMHGKVSVVGRLAGAVPEFNTAALFIRRIRVGGVAVGTYSASESRAAWGKIVQTLGGMGAKPIVDSVFNFEDLPRAFAKLEGGPMGKVLLSVTAAEAGYADARRGKSVGP
jgi:NADPH2:quinone reductase